MSFFESSLVIVWWVRACKSFAQLSMRTRAGVLFAARRPWTFFFYFFDLSCFVGLNIYRTRGRGGAQVYFLSIIYAIQPLKLDLYFCSVWRCGTDARHLLAALREHQRVYSTVERERNFETNCEWQKLWNIVSHTHTHTHNCSIRTNLSNALCVLCTGNCKGVWHEKIHNFHNGYFKKFKSNVVRYKKVTSWPQIKDYLLYGRLCVVICGGILWK